MPIITLRVACAQLKARPLDEAAAALDDIVSAIRKARRLRADLVVLPECSYPGYVLLDGKPYRRRIPQARQALQRVAAAAARNAVHVALGIAREAHHRLQNQAVLIDDAGRELGVYTKSYLWSFDSGWFVKGRAQRTIQTRFGQIGIMICADGRVPEIARRLAAQDAWLILDPTAWVSYGPTFEAMPNPQAEYMLRVRAFENSAWIAAADKCGSEHAAVYYVGRSQIVSPAGDVAALAGTTAPEIIVADVKRRRRTFVSAPAAGAVAILSSRTPKRASAIVWLGVYQAARQPSCFEKAALRTLRSQGVSAIIRTDATPAQLRTALKNCAPVRAGYIEGRAMVVPEPARAAARAGIDLLVWLKIPEDVPALEFARTRALESRIYVLLGVRARPDVSACLIDPNGAVVAAALQNIASAFMAPLDVTASRRKLVVPGTYVFRPSRASLENRPNRSLDERKLLS